MNKKIIITEEQLNKIINEELGISKEVSKNSKELQKILFDSFENKKNGYFSFLDINVNYKTYSFDMEKDFYEWYENNFDKLINGYSFSDKMLYLTFIEINGMIYNLSFIIDTIQHELEHYYQTKMAGHSFSKDSYYNAYNSLNDYNMYIKNISLIEYYGSHFEIDAFVNGAYAVAKTLDIDNYNSFIEKTDLKIIRKSLKEAYSFFKNIPFKGLFFTQMLFFIQKNKYYTNINNHKLLRKKICDKCIESYKYFVRKTSRAYALIHTEKEEIIKNYSNLCFEKQKRYLNNNIE